MFPLFHQVSHSKCSLFSIFFPQKASGEESSHSFHTRILSTSFILQLYSHWSAPGPCFTESLNRIVTPTTILLEILSPESCYSTTSVNANGTMSWYCKVFLMKLCDVFWIREWGKCRKCEEDNWVLVLNGSNSYLSFLRATSFISFLPTPVYSPDRSSSSSPLISVTTSSFSSHFCGSVMRSFLPSAFLYWLFDLSRLTLFTVWMQISLNPWHKETFCIQNFPESLLIILI